MLKIRQNGKIRFRKYGLCVERMEAFNNDLVIRCLDRVVQHCLCDNILRPYFENRLIYDIAACREGKGTDFAGDRLTGFLREHYKKYGTKGYILKYDIRHYFDSIDHEVLKGMLKNIPDRNVLGLLYHIIRSHEGSVDPGMGRKRGLPLGNQTSRWFALCYLDPMDRPVKERMRIKHLSVIWMTGFWSTRVRNT